jgi:hypothetical protein
MLIIAQSFIIYGEVTIKNESCVSNDTKTVQEKRKAHRCIKKPSWKFVKKLFPMDS